MADSNKEAPPSSKHEQPKSKTEQKTETTQPSSKADTQDKSEALKNNKTNDDNKAHDTKSKKDSKKSHKEPQSHQHSNPHSHQHSLQHAMLKNRNRRNIPFMIAYHLVLWTLIAGVTTPLFYLLSHKPKDAKFPSYFGKGSFIGGKPRMTMYPKNIVDGKIEYPLQLILTPNSSLYLNLKEKLDTHFKNQTTLNKIDCRNSNQVSNNLNHQCIFDAESNNKEYGFGDCAYSIDNDFKYGYDAFNPCILISFNKILGFSPSTKRINSGLCNGLDDCCHNYRVPINCTVSNKDVRHQVYPSEGISSCMWPYVGQEDYVNPMAMIKISHLPDGEVKFTCFPDVDGLRPSDVNNIDSKKESHILTFTTTVQGRNIN